MESGKEAEQRIDFTFQNLYGKQTHVITRLLNSSN